MPVAAIPKYLGSNFSDASPGLRFSIFLPVWTERKDQEEEVNNRARAKSREGQEIADLLERKGMDVAIRELQQRQRNPLAGLWEKNDFSAKQAWQQVTTLTQTDKAQMQALSARQTALAQTITPDALFIMDAKSVAPFSTGLGNEHPLENGFAFLNPYGLPYLPGSGVKGVLRRAAEELAGGEWGDTKGWTKPVIHALFGSEPEAELVRGALSVWDVIPQIHGNHLAVDIMTPHQSHYYQNKAAAGSNTPHESGQPNPISFLTVPPGSGFVFHVQCDRALLEHLAPDLAKDNRWQTLLEAAFTHAFSWLGFGAKTSVGYGAMQGSRSIPPPPPEPPDTSPVGEFVADCKRKQESGNKDPFNPGQGLYGRALALSRRALSDEGGWTSSERLKLAEALLEWLPKVIERLNVPENWKEARKKLKLTALREE